MPCPRNPSASPDPSGRDRCHFALWLVLAALAVRAVAGEPAFSDPAPPAVAAGPAPTAAVPAANLLRLVAVGSGAVKGEATVKAMSRGGDR